MMLIDSSAKGGRDLFPLVQALGLPCSLVNLPAGDVAFVGNGPKGPVTVGIERKKVPDIIACIEDDRFAGGQLPKMIRHYEDRWLVVESPYRPARDGILEVPYIGRHGNTHWGEVWGGRGKKHQGWMYRDFTLWLLTQAYMGSMHLYRVHDVYETARFVAALYRWWTHKEWDDHQAHLRLYSQPRDSSLLYPATLLRLIAKELPGVGWKRSKDCERKFPSILEMFEASVEEWAEIGPKPRMGAKRAEVLWKKIRAETGGRNGHERQGAVREAGARAGGRGAGDAGDRPGAPDAAVIRRLAGRAQADAGGRGGGRDGGGRGDVERADLGPAARLPWSARRKGSGDRRGGGGRAPAPDRPVHQRKPAGAPGRGRRR